MEISIVEILLHIVNIVILFLVLRKFLYKPVIKFLNKRTEGIQKQIDEAAKMQTEAEQLKSKYDEMMTNAQELASQIIDQGRSIADDQAKQIVADAEGQASELKDRAKKAIVEQKKQAVIEMRQEVTRIAVQIAEKVLEREVSYEDNKDIIDRFFEKVS